MKKYHPQDLNCLNQLIGKSVKDIYYQPVAGILSYVDMFVVNFGEKAETSLHVFSFFRVTDKGGILLTTSDCFFDNNFERLTSELSDEAREDHYKGTLLASNIEKVKGLLKNSKVINAYSTDIGDVIIEFDNSIKMEVIIDALCNQECYRFISYTENPSQHNVVTYNNGILFYNKE